MVSPSLHVLEGSRNETKTLGHSPRGRDRLVPRTRSSHTRAASQIANFGIGTLARVLVLAPDAKRLLRRSVGDREQHRFLSCLVRIALPGRHHEYVVRTPFEHLILDRGGAAAFGAHEDGAVGRTV